VYLPFRLRGESFKDRCANAIHEALALVGLEKFGTPTRANSRAA
jgi:hypothetical protein